MTDSLNLLALEAGLVLSPVEERAAAAADDLCREMELMRIGDPVPLVFCRRQDGIGGVLVSPPATEARFSNNSTNVLTASWHLVVSEGPIDPIQARDVYQCACRVGSATQTFGRRAGTWSPGNVVVNRGGSYKVWDVHRYCGSPGTYEDMHCLSFVNNYADGEEWNRAVHTFLRGGRHVVRLLDGIEGPSNNVVDLYLLLLRKVERIPENLIDLENLKHAARFVEGLGMRFDGKFVGGSTQSLDDWCEEILKPYFLLQRTRVDGREGLSPLLPTNADGSVFTGRVAAHATLTELDLDLDGWDLQFISLADRRPIRAQMLWRQQADGIDHIVRTGECHFRIPYDAVDGPFEQFDMSNFACSERHIAHVGAYIVAHRVLVHHTLTVPALDDKSEFQIEDGMLVRVKVPRIVDGQEIAIHDYIYRVVSVERSHSGLTTYNLVHFPLDSEGRSALAMAVLSAKPTGQLLPITKSGPVCDVNSGTDNTALPDDSYPADYWNLPDDSFFDIPIDLPLPDPLGPDPQPPEPPEPFEPPGPLEPPEPPPGPPEPPEPPTPPGPGPDYPPSPGPYAPSPGLGPNESQPNPDLPTPTLPPLPTGPGIEAPVGPLITSPTQKEWKNVEMTIEYMGGYTDGPYKFCRDTGLKKAGETVWEYREVKGSLKTIKIQGIGVEWINRDATQNYVCRGGNVIETEFDERFLGFKIWGIRTVYAGPNKIPFMQSYIVANIGNMVPHGTVAKTPEFISAGGELYGKRFSYMKIKRLIIDGYDVTGRAL